MDKKERNIPLQKAQKYFQMLGKQTLESCKIKSYKTLAGYHSGQGFVFGLALYGEEYYSHLYVDLPQSI